MKTGFKDPIEPKVKSKSMKSPWNYDQPHYDERSSCYINAGSHYGVGYKQPVGTIGQKNSDVIPKGRVNTLKIDDVPRGNLPIDMER